MLSMVFCTANLNNPVDRNNPRYVGDKSATDVTAPVLTYNRDDYDSLEINDTAISLFGTIRDLNGVAVMTVNSQNVSGILPNWSATVRLDTGKNTIIIMAQDSSIHANRLYDTLTIIRLGTPKAPRNVAVEMSGSAVLVTWQDNSTNETGFRIERKTNSSNYALIGTVLANSTSFLDTAKNCVASTLYYYRVFAVNAAGTSDSTGWWYVVYLANATADSVGPTIAFASPVQGTVVNTASITVSVTCADLSGIKSVSINNQPAVLEGSYWKASVALVNGSNTITVVAQDYSSRSNVSQASITVTYDASAMDVTAPVITFVSPKDNDVVSVANVTVVVSALDASGTVSWVKLNGTQIVPSGGNYAGNVLLVPGANRVVVEAMDNASNIKTDTLHLIYNALAIDSTAPVIAITAPQNQVHLRDSVLTVTGSVTDPSGIASVTVNDTSATIVSPGFSAQVRLAHGLNTIKVVARDASPIHNVATDSSVKVLYNRVPVFTTVKNDTFINPGMTYTTTVYASDADDDLLSYQFLKSPRLTSATISGAVISGYSPTSVGIDTFFVVVTDVFGEKDTMSWKVNVMVPPVTNLAPEFTNDTATIVKTAVVGQVYMVQLNAVDANNGDTLTYAFLSKPTGMLLSTTGRITWTPAVADTGVKQIAVTVSDGRLLDTIAWTVKVLVPPTIINILCYPQYTTAFDVGGPLRLVAVANGSAPLSYQWKKDNLPISGATTDTYNKNSLSLQDTGTYTCEVSNAAGRLTSTPLNLTTSILNLDLSPIVSRDTFIVGQSCTLSVVASGFPSPRYQWMKGNTAISGANSSKYIVTNIQVTDSGDYFCEVTAGTVTSTTRSSSYAAIKVLSPISITQQTPAYQSLIAGNSCTFSVTATGTSPSYQWKKNGQAIANATSSTYSIASVVVGDSGTYSVVVSNAVSSVPSNNAVLSVLSAPTITTQPNNRMVLANRPCTLSVVASGPGVLTYQWKRNGSAISGATSATFIILSTQVTDSGNYVCAVSNAGGTVLSGLGNVQVYTSPTIITEPRSSQTIVTGQACTLSVVANPSPHAPLIYDWRKGTTKVSSSATYIIQSVTVADSGNYTCLVINAAGYDTSIIARVNVLLPTTITTQPRPVQFYIVGQQCTLSVVASGTSLTYQWQKNGQNISGATAAIFGRATTSLTDSGSYVCVVSGPGGNVVSNPCLIKPVAATVSDIDGNVYHTVIIGGQAWMVENLRTTRLNDGTGIQHPWNDSIWNAFSGPARCYYGNDSINKASVYGALYNWNAVNTGKLAPQGWHVPADSEWTTLINYLGGQSVAGGKLKEVGFGHWVSDVAGGATNVTGFTALPGGYRYNGLTAFQILGGGGLWWSTTAPDAANVRYINLNYNSASVTRNSTPKINGLSVRCLKD